MTEEISRAKETQKIRFAYVPTGGEFYGGPQGTVIFTKVDEDHAYPASNTEYLTKFSLEYSVFMILPPEPKGEDALEKKIVAGVLTHEEHREACMFNLPAYVFGSSPKLPKEPAPEAAELRRQARIICDDTGCGEWNCDDCHPETRLHRSKPSSATEVEFEEWLEQQWPDEEDRKFETHLHGSKMRMAWNAARAR